MTRRRFRPYVTELEGRDVPAAPALALGSDPGGPAMARLVRPTGETIIQVQPFGGGFTGGVRTATADLTGDGVTDLIIAAGPGGLPLVEAYDGADGRLLWSQLAFEPTFTGGVFVAAADFTGDGRAEVIATPDQGGGPIVKVLDSNGGTITAFFGIDDPAFRGGARAATGDVNGDRVPDLLVSAGFGGGPRVVVYGSTGLLNGRPVKLVNDFFAFEPTLRNGAFVGLGDLNADGYADLVFGGGPGGGPRILALNAYQLLSGLPPDLTVLLNQFAGDVNSRAGVRVAVGDLTGNGSANVFASAGDGTPLTAYDRFGATVSLSAAVSTSFGGTSIASVAVPATGGAFGVPGSASWVPFRVTPPVIVPPIIVPPTITNSPPELGTFEPYMLKPGQGLTYGFQVRDAETPTDQLQISATASDPSLFSELRVVEDGVSHVLQIRASASMVGTATIAVTATDAGGLSTTNSFLLTVDGTPIPPTNAPPLLSDFQPVTLRPGQGLTYGFQVADAETSAEELRTSVVVSDDRAFSELRLEGSGTNRTLVAQAATGVNGTVTVRVTVTDGSGSVTAHDFLVTVAGAAGNGTPPVIPPLISPNTPPRVAVLSDVTLQQNQRYTGQFEIDDAETPADQLQVTVSSSNPNLLSELRVEPGGRVRTIVFRAAEGGGRATITVSVRDAGGLTTTRSFEVTVPGTPVVQNPNPNPNNALLKNQYISSLVVGFYEGQYRTTVWDETKPTGENEQLDHVVQVQMNITEVKANAPNSDPESNVPFAGFSYKGRMLVHSAGMTPTIEVDIEGTFYLEQYPKTGIPMLGSMTILTKGVTTFTNQQYVYTREAKWNNGNVTTNTFDFQQPGRYHSSAPNGTLVLMRRP